MRFVIKIVKENGFLDAKKLLEDGLIKIERNQDNSIVPCTKKVKF